MLHFAQIGHARNNDKHHGDGNFYEANRNLMVVCDGVSGENGNGKLAAEAFQKKFPGGEECDESIEDVIHDLIDTGAHQSTIVIAHIRNNILEICSLGDSRAYLINGVNIAQLTTDQSLFERIRNFLPGNIDPRKQGRNEIIGILDREEFSDQLIREITRDFSNDSTEDIFSAKAIPYLLKKFGHLKLLEQCREEVRTRGFSKTLLGMIIAGSTSVLTHHLADRKAKKVVKVDKVPVRPGQEVLLCSDGFYGKFKDKEDILTVAQTKKTVADRINALFTTAKSRVFKDDATLLLGRIAG